MTRGERNNNPGNIRKSDTTWEGEVEGGDSQYVTFSHPEYGIRAMARILMTYEREGLKTIAQAIDRWAPPNENDTEAYIKDVCSDTGCYASQEVSYRSILPVLIKSIIRHENGTQPYSDAQIQAGIALAES